MVSIDSLPALLSRELPPHDAATLWRDQGGWRSRDLSPEDWRLDVPRALSTQIFECAVGTKNIAEAVEGWTPHASASALRDRVERILEGGIGFCLLRSLPICGDVVVDERVALLFGLLFGRPVSQTKNGNLIARVEDLGHKLENPTVRGHQTSAELAFHCDRADRVLLVCVRTAQVGGRSRVVSARAAADALRAEAPDLAARLYRPLPQDRRGEQAPGESPFSALPIFSDTDGVFVGRYVRRFIEDSQRHPHAPRLTFEDIAAMDALDTVIQREGMALEMPLVPGDAEIINNNVVFHGRTAFVDPPNPDQHRLLLRLWLSHMSARPLPSSFGDLFGAVDAGTYRGGVWPNGNDRRIIRTVGQSS